MRKIWIVIICCSHWITTSLSEVINPDKFEVRGGEYCEHATFNAECPDYHVIQMVNASLGRMRVGKCVSETPNPECDVDALPLLHHNCSGVSKCGVDVSNIDKLLSNQTSVLCSRKYRLYLDAHYICVPVETEHEQVCHISATSPTVNQYRIRIQKAEGYLASLTTRQTSKGSERCPWHIRGKPGQTIQVSLLNTHSVVSPTDGVCQIYAYIKESSLSGSMSKLMDCGYDNHGQVYNSLSESVDITVVDTVQDRNFVLHFEAMGCPDIQPTGGAEVVRKANITHVTCGDVTKQLECNGDEWLGDLLDCNLPPATNRVGIFNPWPREWGQELTIVMIISVAVVIAVVIVIVGVCIVRRRPGHYFMPVSQNIGEYGVYGLPGPVVPSKCYYPSLPHPPGNSCGISDSSHYTTTMQRRHAYPQNGVNPPGDTFPRRTTLILQQQDVTSCSSCPVHACTGYPNGTYHDRTGASGWQTFPIRRAEHLYSSPRFDPKHAHDAPYYHELDPREVERQLREQQQKGQSNLPLLPPPNIPVPPIPQEDELDSEGGESFPPPPPPLPPDNPPET